MQVDVSNEEYHGISDNNNKSNGEYGRFVNSFVVFTTKLVINKRKNLLITGKFDGNDICRKRRKKKLQI